MDFKFAQIRIDKTQVPFTSEETLLNDPVGQKVLQLGLLVVGAPPGVATAVVEIGARIVASQEYDTTYEYKPPNGYSLFAAWSGVRSITDKARYSFIWDSTGTIALGIKTPPKDFGEGRSWVDADVKLVYVSNDAIDGLRQAGKAWSGVVPSGQQRHECGDRGPCHEVQLGQFFRPGVHPPNTQYVD